MLSALHPVIFEQSSEEIIVGIIFMPLSEVKSPAKDELVPQVEVYVTEIFKKIGVLISQEAKVDGLQLRTGAFADFRKIKPKTFMLSRMLWDGKEGGLFFLNSIELSIILSAFLMGQPSAGIKEKVRSQAFDDELKEAYGEVSNQLYGAIGQLLVAKKDKGIHLTLTNTELLPEDKSKDNLIDDFPYLFVTFKVKIADQDEQEIDFLMSLNFAQEVYEVDLGYKPGASAAAAGGGVSLGAGGLEQVLAESVMNKNHPFIGVEKTVGDAYDMMVANKVESLPVIEEGRVVRVVTLNNVEIMRSVFFEAPGLVERQARVMCVSLKLVNKTQKLVSAKAADNLKQVIGKMADMEVDSVPVVGDAGEFLGMITSRQILALMASS